MPFPCRTIGAILVACLVGKSGADLSLQAWGADTIRIQITPAGVALSDKLLTAIDGPPARGSVGERQTSSVTNGNLKAELDANGALIFTRVEDGRLLLRESMRNTPWSVEFNFSSSATKLYGMGQNRHGKSLFDLYDNRGLNVIGGSYDFGESIAIEGGPSNSLPWVIAAEPETGFQFGFLWNSPAMGGASFELETMRWSLVSNCENQPLRQQFDFLVTTYAKGATKVDRPFGIIENYVDAVGHARNMPEWGAGYWHSKDRYASQEDLLKVARGFKNRSVPVDVIVIDWHHWDHLGDWSFNEDAWPDPKAMVDELDEMGTKVMVSVWPFSCPGSRSYDKLIKNNWLTTTFDKNGNRTTDIIETHGAHCGLVDPTNADFRKYVWSLLEDGYYKYGIKVFWLDASEPEQVPWENAAWDAGSMRDVGSLFSWYWAKTIHDGLQANGEKDIMMLPRAGWVGTWRWGAVLWSGDIDEKMSTMADSIPIGLSAQSSGIPWWTTDIGGYLNGKPDDPTYRETIIRWFQYGFTCPIFRQHGARSETAIWAYGPQDEQILADLIKLRASLKTYFLEQLAKLTATGRPFNRPMHWDFPNDPKTWELAESGIMGRGKVDQYMMGDDYMAAPILANGQVSRAVYFPKGARWQHHYSGQIYEGGTAATVDAPLENFPLFKRLDKEASIV